MNKEKLNEVLRLHKLWLVGEDEGVQADLRGADLKYACLIGADLREADLRGVALTDGELKWADFTEADLRGADLREADLTNVNLTSTAGDRLIIRSMRAGKYHVVSCDDWLQIGCKGYRYHQWLDFTDEQITRMDQGALDWWREWRDTVLRFCDMETDV